MRKNIIMLLLIITSSCTVSNIPINKNNSIAVTNTSIQPTKSVSQTETLNSTVNNEIRTYKNTKILFDYISNTPQVTEEKISRNIFSIYYDGEDKSEILKNIQNKELYNGIVINDFGISTYGRDTPEWNDNYKSILFRSDQEHFYKLDLINNEVKLKSNFINPPKSVHYSQNGNFIIFTYSKIINGNISKELVLYDLNKMESKLIDSSYFDSLNKTYQIKYLDIYKSSTNLSKFIVYDIKTSIYYLIDSTNYKISQINQTNTTNLVFVNEDFNKFYFSNVNGLIETSYPYIGEKEISTSIDISNVESYYFSPNLDSVILEIDKKLFSLNLINGSVSSISDILCFSNIVYSPDKEKFAFVGAKQQYIKDKSSFYNWSIYIFDKNLNFFKKVPNTEDAEYYSHISW